MGFFKIRPCLVATLVGGGRGTDPGLGPVSVQGRSKSLISFTATQFKARAVKPQSRAREPLIVECFFFILLCELLHPFVAWYTGWLDKVVANSLTQKKSVMWNINVFAQSQISIHTQELCEFSAFCFWSCQQFYGWGTRAPRRGCQCGTLVFVSRITTTVIMLTKYCYPWLMISLSSWLDGVGGNMKETLLTRTWQEETCRPSWVCTTTSSESSSGRPSWLGNRRRLA